jgi:hypothetical protein
MLKTTGVVLATADPDAVAAGWRSTLDAEPLSEAAEPALAARRLVLAVADGFVDILSSEDDGPVAQAVGRLGSHFFAASVLASPEAFGAIAGRAGGRALTLADGSLFLDGHVLGVPNMRLLLRSGEVPARRTGIVDAWYENTMLVDDPDASVGKLIALLDLDRSLFVPMNDKRWGYTGYLTMFTPRELPRFEVVNPHDPDLPMGRFFGKRGPSLYMAFAECRRLGEVSQRLEAAGVRHVVDTDEKGPHTVFVPPAAIGGVMLGLSRPNYAWKWSGAPERMHQE